MGRKQEPDPLLLDKVTMYLVFSASVDEENKAKARECLKNNGLSFHELSARSLSKVIDEKDREEMKKAYRKSYEADERVKLRRIEYYSRPEVRERRKAYNRDPKNVIRKKENAKKRSKLLQLIRETQPELYTKYVLSQPVEPDETPKIEQRS